MSFSVDDLVTSLSSSHIGQEARDLAALQVRTSFSTAYRAYPLQMQLAQSLFPGTTQSASRQMPIRGRPPNPRCTTPVARTPSSSMSRWPMSSRRASSVCQGDFDETDEDERMVEELLLPSSPMNTSQSFSSAFPINAFSNPMPSSPMSSSFQSSYLSVGQPQSPPCDSASSIFATSDPFYLAQLQESSKPPPQSAFSQNGRIAQNSPFALPTMTQNQYHHHPSHFYQHCATAF